VSIQAARSATDAVAMLRGLPLALEPEADGRSYVARGPGYVARFGAARARFQLGSPTHDGAGLELRILGANETAEAVPSRPLPGRSHYLIGDDPARWRRDVPQYERVEYRGVFPGIDVAYYGSQRELEYDFLLAPGADPDRVRLSFAGARALRVERRIS